MSANKEYLTYEKNQTLKTSVALGFFDGLHLGHIAVINTALKTAFENDLIPAVFTFGNSHNNTVLPKMKAYENIISEEQKLILLRELGIKTIYSPDFSEVKDLTAEEFVSQILAGKLNAAYVSCGYDFRFGKGGLGDARFLEKLCIEKGIKTIIIPEVRFEGKVLSSSFIRTLIKTGDIKTANRYLGYSLRYDLPVLHGAKLGRTLNAPTINQIIPESNVIPRFGVYKSSVDLNGIKYRSVTNVGIKPTTNSGDNPLMETHIIGFDGDLYGQVVGVTLIDFIRDEVKFDDILMLKKQIKNDIEAAGGIEE